MRIYSGKHAKASVTLNFMKSKQCKRLQCKSSQEILRFGWSAVKKHWYGQKKIWREEWNFCRCIL